MRNTRALIVLSLFLLLAGCSMETGRQPQSLISEVVHELSSATYKGRLAGTEGNELATQYLVQRFEEIGLEAWHDGGFLHTYSQPFVDPEKVEANLQLLTEGDNVHTFTRGTDFLERSLFSDYEATYALTDDPDDPGLENKYILLDQAGQINEVYDRAQGVLYQSELSRTLHLDTLEKPIIQLTAEAYERLQEAVGSELRILFEADVEEIEAANVVGRITGRNSNQAIVISAHFDHVGWVGDMVYYGAIDNASGVAVLLDLADKLMKDVQNGFVFEQDILFVAFNGEESGMLGSQQFVQDIMHRYKDIYNLNIDSIYAAPLAVTSSDEEAVQQLVSDTLAHLRQQGIDAEFEIRTQSDHDSFLKQHMNAISISSQNLSGRIHLSSDTADRIDNKFLEQVSEALHDFLIANHDVVYEHYHEHEFANHSSNGDDKELRERVWQEAEKLRFDEYKLLQIGEDEYYIVTPSDPQMSYDMFQETFPEIDLPSVIGEYQLKTIHAYLHSPGLEREKVEPDRVYRRTRISREDLYSLRVYYRSADELIMSINVTVKDDLNNIADHYHDDEQLSSDFTLNGREMHAHIDQTGNVSAIYYGLNKNGHFYETSLHIWNVVTVETEQGEIERASSILSLDAFTQFITDHQLLDIVDQIVGTL